MVMICSAASTPGQLPTTDRVMNSTLQQEVLSGNVELSVHDFKLRLTSVMQQGKKSEALK